MTELKEILIQRIQETDAPNILADISRILEVNTDVNEVYVFSEAQLAAITEAREQVRRGQERSWWIAKKQIVWTLRARHDRIVIFDYWVTLNGSKDYAEILNDLFNEAAELVSLQPKSGKRTA